MRIIKFLVLAILVVLVVTGIGYAALWPSVRPYVRTRVLDLSHWASGWSDRDMTRAIDRRVADESADYVLHHMGLPPAFPNKLALFDASLARVDPKLNGMYCEFGVFTGGTINYIASKVPSLVHGFDSFEGLPEAWRAGFSRGEFAVKELPGVRSNVRLYKGWFKDSLPVFKKDHPEPLAFGHLDADLYVSTKDVFEALNSQIVEGTVLQFDEFLNYPGWEEGELKAFNEFCAARACEAEYIGYVPSSQQVALRIKKIGPVAANGAAPTNAAK